MFRPGDGGHRNAGFRQGRSVPYAGNDPGRRSAGSDDGAGHIPGTPHHTAGQVRLGCLRSQNQREHHIINSLYLDAPLLEAKVKERFKRYAIIEETETDAELYCCEDAEIVVTAYGASARVSKSAVTAARRKGIKAGLFRPKTLWPFPKKELCEATKHASHILDVEMSMGQMIDDVRLATECRLPVSFFGRTGGVIPTPAEVLAEIEKLAGGAE